MDYQIIDLKNNYWNVGTITGSVYSTSARAYIDSTDSTYQAWVAAGNLTRYEASDEDMQATVARIFLPQPATAYQFQLLFTQAERTAIATAAISNGSIMAWMLLQAAAQTVAFDDPNTVSGIGALVAAGLLTQTRANQILSNTAPV
jgi:hypothetical protein